ncbi:hypothetical protein POTOM_056357 [Populus tomentosa]|uniref:Phosphatidylinositol-specific phospholipase C X domain-containing protein n=1 Tax=Populus tomentosa TaxID=118781 RepID=A0A8X7XUK9_POPTO|nr:hypothetical protein POTOM_056357 [Populus tomentosa]
MRTIAVRRTLTNPVDLLVCLRAIKNNAFQASEYPVVITFEDHPPANLQAKVAEQNLYGHQNNRRHAVLSQDRSITRISISLVIEEKCYDSDQTTK